MSSQLTKHNGDFGREKCRDPVTVVPEQPVIEAGPYRLIRHPSYTGSLITLLGFGLSSTNWLSLLALMGCALLGFSYRIRVEEHVLRSLSASGIRSICGAQNGSSPLCCNGLLGESSKNSLTTREAL